MNVSYIYQHIFLMLISWCQIVTGDILDIVDGDLALQISRACQDPSLENTHTWYLLDEHTKVWSNCRFPNPRHDMVRCGRTPPLPNVTQPLYTVCDPDNVLSADEVSQVDAAVWRFAQQTPHQCTTVKQQKMNFTLMFAVVQHMRLPDLSRGEAVCMNQCNEIQPTLNLHTRNPTSEEKSLALLSFTTGLQTTWQKDTCDSAIVYVIWAKEKMSYLMVGENVSKRISTSETKRILKESLKHVERGNFKDALLYVAEEYRSHLKVNTPALVLLGIYAFLMLGTVAFFMFLFYGSDPLGYWDEMEVLSPLKGLVKLVSGIYFVEYLLVVIMYLQDRLRVWHAGVLFVAFLLLFFVYMA